MKQKVALAGALIHDPRLLMLDEPLTGLDAAIARQVKDLLVERVRAGAIVLTTHILDVAERLADRIGIIHDGRLIAEGTLADLRSSRRTKPFDARRRVSRIDGTNISATHCHRRMRRDFTRFFMPGSFGWLIAQDLRLSLRRLQGMFGALKPRTAALILLAALVAFHGLAWPVAHWLGADGDPRLFYPSLAAGVLFVLFWLISQSLTGATRALYTRGDLDLLLASPLPPTHILGARAIAIAAEAMGAVAILVLPITNMNVLVNGWRWLAIYPLCSPAVCSRRPSASRWRSVSSVCLGRAAVSSRRWWRHASARLSFSACKCSICSLSRRGKTSSPRSSDRSPACSIAMACCGYPCARRPATCKRRSSGFCSPPVSSPSPA